MNHFTKKLTATLLLSFSALACFADGEFVINNLRFRISDNNTATFCGCVAASSPEYLPTTAADIEIPSEVIRNGKKYPVTHISNYSFEYGRGGRWIESVKLPETITDIALCAFEYCRQLKSLTIPNSVTSLGYKAFNGCTSLREVTIGEGLTDIGYSLFEDCDALECVYYNATNADYNKFGANINNGHPFLNPFGGNCVKKIVIGDNVTNLPYTFLRNITSLESLTLGSGIPDYAYSVILGYYESFWNDLSNMNLKELICTSFEPHQVSHYSSMSLDMMERLTAIPLYVPAGSIEAYKNHPFWGRFISIQESSSSGIPVVTGNQTNQVRWFDINGIPLSDIPDRGIYIQTDGQTSKVMYAR
ncbi:MAG: leucine-rich repeat domain-containing protein [Muribaculaceae bacterium]|nr:leucine-rich repeat domain-containing protein [Muribaculaceae bacterium]